MVKLKVWLLETRPQFLILSVVLAFLGTSIAWYDGAFHPGFALLALAGLLLCHISANVLNDYFDYRSGIDLETRRTPFSGGSGILPLHAMKPNQVFWFGIIAFLLAIPIGGYFVVSCGWLLLPLLVVGAACILLYTPLLLKLGWPEWAPGISMGFLPVLGFYFVQTSAYTLPAVVAAVPSGILVHNLLLLNEFPDVPADTGGGRRTLPIVWGKRKSGIFYSVLTIVMYCWIVGAVILGFMPVFSLLALATIPLAIRVIQRVLRHWGGMEGLMPAMGENVLVVMLTQVLLGVGYIIAGVLA